MENTVILEELKNILEVQHWHIEELKSKCDEALEAIQLAIKEIHDSKQIHSS